MMSSSNRPIEYERRTVREWLLALLSGSLALPLFQRSYVWTDKKTSDLVMALFRGHPVGTMLLIDRYSQPVPKRASTEELRRLERFSPRSLAGARADLDNCRELILDGQQRLTSLWRALELTPETGLEEAESHGHQAFLQVDDLNARNMKPSDVTWPSKNQAEHLASPRQASTENLIPLKLFDPRAADPAKGPNEDPLKAWCRAAADNAADAADDLWWRISEQLRKPLLDRNIWYARLPADMSRSDAIQVFVKVNESSAVIRKFDIAVAEYDRGTQGRSLRDEISRWADSTTHAEAFFGADEEAMIPKAGELVLKVACLQERKAPTDSQYTSPSVIARLRDGTKLRTIFDGMAWTFDFLGEECIWRDKHLPSAVPLRVLPALWPELKANADDSDLEGRTRRCLRAYLWRAFVTERYNQAANTRLKEDFEGLQHTLRELRGGSDVLKALERHVPIFSSSYPLPEHDALSDLGEPLAPPTRKNSLSRSLLVASLHGRALDFGSGEPVSASNVRNREAHHVFPTGFLRPATENAKQINHCLNYALVSGPTNRRIAAKPPHMYLRDRYRADSSLTESELRRRIESHMIPYGSLIVRDGNTADDEYKGIVKEAYQGFIAERAKQMTGAICKLADGTPL